MSSPIDSPLELIILTKNLSSWSLRAWLPLVHWGIPFEERLLAGHDAGDLARLAAISPTAKVPVLVHGDVVVHESLAIFEYLSELFPEKQLWPADRAARAHARAICAEMHAGFAELRRNMPMNLARTRPLSSIDPATARDVARIDAIIRETRAKFGADGRFLFGAYSLADAMFTPVATRFRSYGVATEGVTKAWCESALATPAMTRWRAEALALAAHEPMVASPGKVVAGSAEDYDPPAPCYAVVFTNQLANVSGDASEYGTLAKRMVELAQSQEGFVGYETTRSAEGLGITVSYWRSLDAVAAWRAHLEHRIAQAAGRARFYAGYRLTVARVERESSFGPPEILALLRAEPTS